MIPPGGAGAAGRSDADLVAAAQGGDRLAMESLLRRHHDRLYAVCAGVVGPSDADDAAQAAMISIVGGLARFDGRSAFTTWSHRIAVNAALDELRRRKRRPVPHDPRDGAGDDGHRRNRELERAGRTSKEPMPDTTSTPSSDSAARDPAQAVVDRHLVEDALAGLPEDFRVPLVLAEYGGLEYAEIANTLDLPVGTVRSRIARARTRLANHRSEPR